MRKAATVLLIRCRRHSHVSTLQLDASFFARSFATSTDGEVCAVSAVSMGELETTKARKKRAPSKPFSSGQDLGGSERSSHAEVVAEVAAKASGKVNSVDSTHGLGLAVVSGMEKTRLTGTDAMYRDGSAKAGRDLAAGKRESLALSAQPTVETSPAQKSLAEMVVKLDLQTYRWGKQWEEASQKLLDYGIPPAYVSRMLGKCRRLTCSVHRVDSMLNHFSLLGMSHVQIGQVIVRWPTILNTTDRMFLRKLELFDSMGIDRHVFSKGKLAVFLCSVPCLRKNAAFLKDYMAEVRTDAVAIMMSKDPEILVYNIRWKLAWLESHMVEKAMVLRNPRILQRSLHALSTNAELLARLGILDARKRAQALCKICGFNAVTLQARHDNLLAAGFSCHQLQTIVSNHPCVLMLREELVNAKLNYAVQVMKLPLEEIASCLTFWSVSLERRIKPRYEVVEKLQTLGARRRGVRLSYLIAMSDEDFHRKFLQRYRDACKLSSITSHLM